MKARVLCVDDDRVIADALAMILSKEGYEVRAAYSGEQAIEVAPELKPDALISDVFMCGMNGIDVAIRIHQILPSIKIQLYSGQVVFGDLLERAHAQGHNFEIWGLPFHPQDMLSWLRRFE